jgi:RNA polymerase sigma-70 factor (ECF subfamily)
MGVAGPLPPPERRRADFEGLYQRLRGEIWASVYARGMSTDLALDCTQEAFLRLWQQWQRGEAIRNPRAWLVRVARNLAQTHVRSAFGRNGTQAPELLCRLPEHEPLPIESLEREETRAQVRQALARLRPADRRILTLRYALGYSPRKIAEVLAAPVTAINMRLSRARQRVAALLLVVGVSAPP